MVSGFWCVVACRDLCFLGKRQETSCVSETPWVVVTDFCMFLRNLKCQWCKKETVLTLPVRNSKHSVYKRLFMLDPRTRLLSTAAV